MTTHASYWQCLHKPTTAIQNCCYIYFCPFLWLLTQSSNTISASNFQMNRSIPPLLQRWSMAFSGCRLPECWKYSRSKVKIFHCKLHSVAECTQCPNAWEHLWECAQVYSDAWCLYKPRNQCACCAWASAGQRWCRAEKVQRLSHLLNKIHHMY